MCICVYIYIYRLDHLAIVDITWVEQTLQPLNWGRARVIPVACVYYKSFLPCRTPSLIPLFWSTSILFVLCLLLALVSGGANSRFLLFVCYTFLFPQCVYCAKKTFYISIVFIIFYFLFFILFKSVRTAIFLCSP